MRVRSHVADLQHVNVPYGWVYRQHDKKKQLWNQTTKNWPENLHGISNMDFDANLVVNFKHCFPIISNI